MKPYGRHGRNAYPSDVDKGHERIAGKQEAKREFDQMINDYNYYIWSDEVDLCIYCRISKKLCGDCEYWNNVTKEEKLSYLHEL